MIRLIIVDDHQIVLDGLSLLLKEEKGINLLQTFTNPLEAMSFIKGNEVDLVITDLDMGEANGEDVIAYCDSQGQSIHVIVLSMHNETSVIKHLLKLGADGYLTKDSGKEEMIKAIKTVSQGAKYFSEQVLTSLLSENEVHVNRGPEMEKLSEREIEIIKLIADGLSSKAIAEQLFISPRTADTHRDNISKKLGIKGAAGIIRFAFENKLVE